MRRYNHNINLTSDRIGVSSRLLALTGALSFGGAVSTADGSPPLAIFDLGNPYGLRSSAQAITTDGKVLVNFESPHVTNGFGIWERGTLTEYTPTTDSIYAYDLNSSKLICGHFTYPGLIDRAFAMNGSGKYRFLDEGPPIESAAYASNDAGVLVGWLQPDEDWPPSPVIWQGEAYHLLPNFSPDRTSIAYGVNVANGICGYSLVDGSPHAVLWPDSETIIDLGTLPGSSVSEAYAINDAATVTGYSYFALTRFAALWRQGEIHGLGYQAGDAGFSTAGYGINNLDVVVGSYWKWDTGQPRGGFVWTDETGMVDLQTLLPRKSGWDIEGADDINDADQIVGLGVHNGITRAFLLSPVSPTMTVSQPAPGFAGEVNTLTLSNCTPGTRVYLTYAIRGGGTIIPGCDLQENALMLDSPKLAGSIVADANGEGVFTFFVPDAARNLGDILIQAVVPGECAVSNLVVEGFE